MTSVQELWRYPVASVGGERVSEIDVSQGRVSGDREFFLVDLCSGEVAMPEKLPRWRPALYLSARWEDADGFLTGPSWSRAFSDSDLDELLSIHFGFKCGLRSSDTTLESLDGSRSVSSRYKVSPLHIISAEAIARLGENIPSSRLDVRRFRPTIVVDTDFIDEDAVGRQFDVGLVRGFVTETTTRCGMTLIAQPGLPEDPEILRTILRRRNRRFGLYATITEGTKIAVGDAFSFV